MVAAMTPGDQGHDENPAQAEQMDVSDQLLMPPRLSYMFTARVEIAPPLDRGETHGLRNRFFAITGGTVVGPRLVGRVLPGGGDWQAITSDGVAYIQARYFIEADDGTIIAVDNPGVRVASADVVARMMAGDPVDPSEYYFCTSPRFDVASGPHAWLGRAVFIARGARRRDHVQIDFHLVS